MTTNTNDYKSKTTAGLLAIFLGAFGIHKFYLGRIGWGIAYILFCWTLVPAVVGLIEGLMYFSMNGKDFDYKYNIANIMENKKVPEKQSSPGRPWES